MSHGEEAHRMPGRSSDAQDAVQQLTERYDCNARRLPRAVGSRATNRRIAARPRTRRSGGPRAGCRHRSGHAASRPFRHLPGGASHGRGPFSRDAGPAPSRYGRALMDAQQLGAQVRQRGSRAHGLHALPSRGPGGGAAGSAASPARGRSDRNPDLGGELASRRTASGCRVSTSSARSLGIPLQKPGTRPSTRRPR